MFLRVGDAPGEHILGREGRKEKFGLKVNSKRILLLQLQECLVNRPTSVVEQSSGSVYRLRTKSK